MTVDIARLTAAMHEAGHAVAAVLYGGRVHLATLDTAPRTEYDNLPERHRAAITYAGPWCEARFLANRHPGPADLHRVMSVSLSDDAALCAAGGLAAVPADTAGLLTRCWPAVELVGAGHLYHDGKATHADVCAALGLSDDGGPGSFELAGLRAGLRVVQKGT